MILYFLYYFIPIYLICFLKSFAKYNTQYFFSFVLIFDFDVIKILFKFICLLLLIGRVSSNVNEVIRAVLTFLFIYFFLQKDFTHMKKHKTHISEQKQKRQRFYVHKKHLLIWVFVIFMLFCVCKIFS